MARLHIPRLIIQPILVVLCALMWPLPGTAATSGDNYSPAEIQRINRLAHAGRPQAQYSLARLYLSGRGLKMDPQRGMEWLQKAAEQNHGEAQNQLGLLYLSGVGVTRDCQRAGEWFSRVSETSEAWRQARSNLAWVLATCPQADSRDGERAIQIVQQLLGERHDNPSLLDTLAAALAETGQFEQAIATQQRAIALLESQPAAAQQHQRFSARLQTYQRNHPWRIDTH